MDFEIDLETFNDLEIFTDRGASQSVFSIFNRTRTDGGKNALREMMLHPSLDPNLLANRRDAISYFSEQHLELEFSFSQLDMIEHYLLFNKRLLRNNILDALYDHLYNKINPTNDYYVITQGIIFILKLLNFAADLFRKLEESTAPHFLLEGFEPIKKLLKNKTIEGIISAGKKTKVSFVLLHRLDRFFRKQELENTKLLLRFIYELDVYECASEILNKEGWSLPQYLPNGAEEIHIDGLIHPAIHHARANNVSLPTNKTVLFLTGPNMAGKSSFLKSVGLAVFLAHIGFPVPAREMKTPVYKGLLTTINLPDNIYKGASHYHNEVLRLKKTAQKLLEKESMFIIIDELFRGTNVKDAFEASLLTINNLCRIRHCKFLISTHITELVAALKTCSGISFKCFDSSFKDGKPVFSYQMKDGVSEDRMGMYIIESEKVFSILEMVIEKKEKEFIQSALGETIR